MDESILRLHLAEALAWGDAHVTFDAAVARVPASMRGVRAENFPHSLWELLEHVRIAQNDILDFIRNPQYAEREWPRQYWPATPGPPSPTAWDETVEAISADRTALQALAADGSIDLGAAIPHGSGQSYIRELLLVVDHTSYHVGQMVAVRRLLGIWGAD